MRPLFWRILLLLLSSFAVTIAAGFFLVVWLKDFDHDGFHVREHSLAIAEKLVDAVENNAFPEARKELLRRFRMDAWIVLEGGNSLGKRPVNDEIMNLIGHFPQVIRPNDNPVNNNFIYAHLIDSNNSENSYKVILSTPLPPFRLKPHGRNRTGPVFIFILAVVAASTLMSWWILRPLQAFSKTVQQLSSENLSERIPREITLRKDAFGSLARDFNIMAERVEDTIENQKRLLRDVSHELRTPLTRILMASAVAAKKTGASSELDRIEQEVGKLDLLISDLLTLSRTETSHNIEQHPVSLAELIRPILQDVNFEYQNQARVARHSIPENLLVQANPKLLQVCFENLIRNAMRHTNPETTVEIEVETVPSGTKILITDKGPGVPVDSLDKVFEPFYKEQQVDSESSGQHGIGLTLAKSIVVAHGGTIQAKNPHSGGLRIEIVLPDPPSTL